MHTSSVIKHAKGVIICFLLALITTAFSGSVDSTVAQEQDPATVLAQLAQSQNGNAAHLPIRDRMNRWTIGLASGRIEGAPLRFAGELARVLDDGDKMRVLPVVTRGVYGNVNDLLYLKGIDTAIIYSDVVEEFNKRPAIRKNINYVASLFTAEIHVIARPDIKTLADLKGKVVNFNTFGTPAAYTGPMIFKRLHIGAINSFIPNPVAVGKMRKGIDSNIAAVVFVSSKPLTPFLRSWPKGFHFLRVPYDKVLKDYYLPSMLTHEDYPELIPEGKRVLTVSVPAVLAAFNWEHNADRYRRMGRFVRYFFKRLHILQTKPGYHPKWKNVNLGANVPGWNRCPTATEILKQKKEIKPSVTEEELLQEFLRWRKSRGK